MKILTFTFASISAIIAAVTLSITSTAGAISYTIPNGTTSANISASLNNSCAVASTTDDLIIKNVNDQRIRTLSSLSSSQRTNFYNAVAASVDPNSGTTKRTSMNFDFEANNQIGLYYSDPNVPSDDGGIYFTWDVCLHVRVFDNAGHFNQITYYSDPASVTDEEHPCYQGSGDDQRYIPLTQGLLSGRSVINREWSDPDQMITDDITLSWIPNAIVPAPLPVSDNFYVPMAFDETIFIEDAYQDLNGDTAVGNEMGFLFADMINDGVNAVSNYSIEIVIPGVLESRCQTLSGETDPNLIWVDLSGSGEQGIIDYDTESAYLKF